MGPQNYRCKDCGRQFISGYEKTCRGYIPSVIAMVKIMPVRGIGIRDIAAVLHISVKKVLKTLTAAKYRIKPKQQHYDTLEINEFWTYAGKKSNLEIISPVSNALGKIAASPRSPG